MTLNFAQFSSPLNRKRENGASNRKNDGTSKGLGRGPCHSLAGKETHGMTRRKKSGYVTYREPNHDRWHKGGWGTTGYIGGDQYQKQMLKRHLQLCMKSKMPLTLSVGLSLLYITNGNKKNALN